MKSTAKLSEMREKKGRWAVLEPEREPRKLAEVLIGGGPGHRGPPLSFCDINLYISF